jgi:phosphatidylglycerol:prolipoprotein diacylglycerol transferase
MIDFMPQPVIVAIGPISVYWYGLCYAIGLAAAYWVLVRQASYYRQDTAIIANGMIVIAIAALIGGRLYHVIDRWDLYRDDLAKIVLPPYTGLGVYGGLITGIVAFLFLVRHYRISGWLWADIAAPAIFTMQAIGRWGNFFNQELYGPPTTLPWGIAIDCAHRIAAYPCDAYPVATTHFQPLFLYESVSGLLGALVLVWLSRSERARRILRPGDLAVILFIWYAIVRFLLEFLRSDYNWKLGAMPTAQIFSIIFIVGSLAVLAYRHAMPASRIGRSPFEPEPVGPSPFDADPPPTDGDRPD